MQSIAMLAVELWNHNPRLTKEKAFSLAEHIDAASCEDNHARLDALFHEALNYTGE